MVNPNTEGSYPIDSYVEKPGNLPPGQDAAFDKLEQVAMMIAPKIDRRQERLLDPYRKDLAEIAKTNPTALDPNTLPDSNGHFVPYWEHPEIRPLLIQAHALMMEASSLAHRDPRFASFLYESALNLTSGDRISAIKVYIDSLAEFEVNFHLLPFETDESGKLRIQAFLGSINRDLTDPVALDVRHLRRVADKRFQGKWGTSRTVVRVDRVHAMTGFLGMIDDSETAFDRLDPYAKEPDPVSAHNVPNEPEIRDAVDIGNVINIFENPYKRKVGVIKRISPQFLSPALTMSEKDGLAYLTTHEFAHDRKADRPLEEYHQVLIESFATFLGLDLAGETWNPDVAPENFAKRVRGAIGYALKDCEKFFLSPDRPLDFGRMRVYQPGSLVLLTEGSRTAFRMEDGIIVDVNLKEFHKMVVKLAKEEWAIWSKGTERDVRDHFEGLFPQRPPFKRSNSPMISQMNHGTLPVNVA